MKSFVIASTWTKIPEDSPCFVECGDTELALVKLEGRVYALHDACPHRAGPLSEGELEDGKIRCPWHGALIDPITGDASAPATRPATCVKTRQIGDNIEVLL